MAITLVQAAKLETEPLRKGIIMNLIRYNPLMGRVPFEDVNSLTNIAVRATNLPNVAFRRINEGYTPSEGDFDQVYESVYGFGGEIEFDRVFEKIGNTIIKPRVAQTRLKLRSMAITWSKYFLSGDHATDEDGFEGLKKRIESMPARQKVRAGASGATAVIPTGSAALGRAFLDGWEEAHYKANGGNVGMILCNEGIYWGLGRTLRYLGISAANIMDQTKDLFDREVTTYKGVPMVDVGFDIDQVTELIPNNELAADAGADATSVYFVSFDTEQGIMGIQLSPMEVYDPLTGGERESKPTKLLRIDWWNGLAGFGSYGFTRLWNISDPALWA